MEALIYGLGIVTSILASKGAGGDWIPENKFSFRPSAIFPTPVLTAGTIAGLSMLISFPSSIFGYLIPIILGLFVGGVVTRYLPVMNPPTD